ncbi:MAG: 16S rRNA processing protein RimM [Oscillospiraceae bacterium]|nr:16S rRNA processing protein RimM [Oscillospiraceae bacterium]
MKQAYIEAGRITSTHGVHGEVKIEVWLDTPEDLKHYRRIFIDGQKKKLLSVRQQNRFVIVKLHQIDDINAAQPLKGKTVFIAREDAPLPPGGYFLQDLLDAKVVLEDGSPVGVLTEILERPANNVYVVTDPDGKEILIPVVPAFIIRADAENGIVTVRLLEGM